jgi:hypothetical protein
MCRIENRMTVSVPTQKNLLLLVICMAAVLWMGGGVARWFVLFGCIAVVPGWWLQQWTASRVPFFVRATIGFAGIAAVYAWAAWAEFSMPPWVWQAALGAGTVSAVARWWRAVDVHTITLPTRLGGVAIVLVSLTVVWTRVAQIADIAMPPWVDSVHHALLIRVAVEAGHAPWNLEPYLPVAALTYHSGYHSIMAVLLSLSAIPLRDIAEYLRISGQVWNVCAVLSVAALVWQWTRSWWATSVTIVVAGVVSIMPAYYLSWGRYTLLTGMVFLPAALWLIDDCFKPVGQRVHWVWLGAVMTLLALTHMVVFVIALLWGGALLIVYGAPSRWVVRPVLMALALTVPWWLFVGAHVQAGAGASAMHVAGNPSHNGVVWGLVWALNNRWLVPALVCALAVLVRMRVRRGLALVGWIVLTVLMANPVLIGLPYLSFFTNETITSGLYIPIAIGIGLASVHAVRRLPEWVTAVTLGVVIAASVGGIVPVVRDTTIIATADDQAVLQWAVDNMPRDATVMTNSAGWMWGVDRGADGGWWLLPVAGIAVTTPPVLYTYADPVARAWIAETTAQLRDADGSLAFVERFVAEHREVNYIYASERGSAAKPSVLDTSSQFELRFRSGDAAIYAVLW